MTTPYTDAAHMIDIKVTKNYFKKAKAPEFSLTNIFRPGESWF
jgi:hypothetical protein